MKSSLDRYRQYRQRRAKARARERWADQVCTWVDGLAGKRILEVGCDLQGALARYISDRYQPAELVGLNPYAKNVELSSSCRLDQGDIRKAPYPDDHFDVILSTSAFEHIHDFDVALQEMYRVLRPGGYLYSRFGPIWSTSYGHHLWLIHNGNLYNYWNVILPSYCHLLMTREQVADHLRSSYDEDVVEVISNYVFGSDEQNRLFYEDYENIIRSSPFEVMCMKGYDHPELGEKYNHQVTPEILRALRARFPEYRNFGYDGILLPMSKPTSGGVDAHASGP